MAEAWAASVLRFGFNPSNSPPLLYQFENQKRPIPTGGLIYEMSVAIGDDLHQDYAIVRVPRRRIAQEVITSHIDLICHNSQRWHHAFKDEAVWSRPLYTYANVLVSKKDFTLTRTEQITGTIGTVENYVYPDLEKRFKNKNLTRDDAESVAVNVKRLLTDRLEYIIMSEIEFNYYKSTYPHLQRSPFLLDKTPIQCSLSKKSNLSLQRLNLTIDRLTKKQVFEKIYQRYLDPKTAPRLFTYGLNGNDSPPFLIFDRSMDPPAIQGGIFFDLAREMGKQLKRPFDFVLLPRGRLDARLAEGQIELVCYDNEVWAGEYGDKYFWSIPIFRQTEFVVSLAGVKGVKRLHSIKDLKGQRVGTVLHFIYPNLNQYFEEGSIHREDAGSGMANLAKLNSQRVPYIILNNLEYAYYKKQYPRLQKAPFLVNSIDVKCAVSKKSDIKVEQINMAIREMIRTGQMQKILLSRE